jgi:signal transduction histidine kinase
VTVTPDVVTVRWVQLALGALAVAGVMVSSRLPVLAVIVTAAATASAWLMGVTADPFVLTGFAVFGLAETRGGRKFPWWMFAGAIVVLVTSAIFGAEGAEDRFRGMLMSAVVLSVAWVLGVRTREVTDEVAARSRAEERLRLARDVHDVLSHSLGAIGVQAGVAAHVTALDTEELRGVLRGIEGDARSSLSELKTLLQRERTDADADASSPLSAALAGVVQTAERAGVAVHLDSDGGAVDTLPAGVRTTALRVVQEAVTNVIRHAGASSVIVTIRISSDTMTVRVEDDGQGAQIMFRPGHGLTGMRERVELLGGAVDLASSSSGFTVYVALPLQTPPSDGGRG